MSIGPNTPSIASATPCIAPLDGSGVFIGPFDRTQRLERSVSVALKYSADSADTLPQERTVPHLSDSVNTSRSTPNRVQ